MTPSFTLKRLAWTDESLGTIAFPKREMHLRASFGSGLTRRFDDPSDIVWGVGDRGPNIKVKTLVERYGARHFRQHLKREGAKVMPRLDIGPCIARLRIGEDRVELLDTIRLCDREGIPVSGLPIPGSKRSRREPVFDLDGRELEPDPAGFDTEGIAATRDGGFWIVDEFGPSLVRVDSAGRIIARIVPEGVKLAAPGFEVREALPAIAVRRHLNRGFEALALSADERWLFLAFQSPLAHPAVAAHKRARHVRVWRLDASTLEVVAQYLYPLEPPEHFLRDLEAGPLDQCDIKLSEIVWIGEDALLVLERASLSTRIYRVDLDACRSLPPEHLDHAVRPSIEKLSPRGVPAKWELGKRLLFDSDRAREVPADIEGMVVLSSSELLLVNDNDFGVEGEKTQFWKIIFDQPIL
jgi:hypothetical protein